MWDIKPDESTVRRKVLPPLDSYPVPEIQMNLMDKFPLISNRSATSTLVKKKKVKQTRLYDNQMQFLRPNQIKPDPHLETMTISLQRNHLPKPSGRNKDDWWEAADKSKVDDSARQISVVSTASNLLSDSRGKIKSTKGRKNKSLAPIKKTKSMRDPPISAVIQDQNRGPFNNIFNKGKDRNGCLINSNAIIGTLLGNQNADIIDLNAKQKHNQWK